MAAAPQIAIVGAGLAGLRLAHELSDVAKVTVFEKSRGLGGRMSTRRADAFQFDHGAQYFTAHGPAFQGFLAPFIKMGTVQEWRPHVVRLSASGPQDVDWSAPRYVATPGMTGLCKELAKALTIVSGTRITNLEREGQGWQLTSLEGTDYGPFDWVLSTAPHPQTLDLMPDTFAEVDALKAVKMQGCYSLMLGFEAEVDLGWQAAIVSQGPLAWLAVNSSKPERPAHFSLMVQSSNDWADAHLDDDQSAVQATLLEAVGALTGLAVETASYVSLHRWRYAKVSTPASKDHLIDAVSQLGSAGDWCGAGRVEAAFDSATALARAVRGHLDG